MTATPIDGRSARAARTREAIVDACIGLVEEGELRPTAPQVAERADVSVRSVFQHFADLPSLHSAVARRIVERLEALLIPAADASQPLDQRIDAFVEHRGALLEAITPYRRAANVHGPFAPQIRETVRVANEYLRSEIAHAFQPELDALPDEQRDTVLDALATVMSWAAWDVLRADTGRDVQGAVAAVTQVVRALLLPLGPDGSQGLRAGEEPRRPVAGRRVVGDSPEGSARSGLR